MNGFKRNWANTLLGKATAVILISALVACNDTQVGGDSAGQKKCSTSQQTKERDLCSHR